MRPVNAVIAFLISINRKPVLVWFGIWFWSLKSLIWSLKSLIWSLKSWILKSWFRNPFDSKAMMLSYQSTKTLGSGWKYLSWKIRYCHSRFFPVCFSHFLAKIFHLFILVVQYRKRKFLKLSYILFCIILNNIINFLLIVNFDGFILKLSLLYWSYIFKNTLKVNECNIDTLNIITFQK